MGKSLCTTFIKHYGKNSTANICTICTICTIITQLPNFLMLQLKIPRIIQFRTLYAQSEFKFKNNFAVIFSRIIGKYKKVELSELPFTRKESYEVSEKCPKTTLMESK